MSENKGDVAVAKAIGEIISSSPVKSDIRKNLAAVMIGVLIFTENADADRVAKSFRKIVWPRFRQRLKMWKDGTC